MIAVLGAYRYMLPISSDKFLVDSHYVELYTLGSGLNMSKGYVVGGRLATGKRFPAQSGVYAGTVD